MTETTDLAPGAARSRASEATDADPVNAIRALSMDAVQKANSGHPGMPMGMAEIAEVLWRKFLRHNPSNPAWADRDRFILSNGHGSMLQYALLHLAGYDLPIAELRNFRQLHSKTPGHPEVGITPGVETTTGPLGQGLANAVGFALAERLLAAEFNRPGHAVVDHRTWVMVGDGCLMEGISHEACSLAGTLGLAKLVVLYDDNGISIDGDVRGWFRDDTPKRFAAYGWNVIPDVDGHDPKALASAMEKARAESARPTLVCCKTVIGKGAPTRAGTAKAHGEALGEAEIAATRTAIGWPHAPFEVPEAVYRAWDARESGKAHEAEWNQRFDAYARAHPGLAGEFKRRMAGDLPAGWAQAAKAMVARAVEKAENVASRKASQQALEAMGPVLPELIGGSADLTGSNLTTWSGSKTVTSEGPGNYVNFGVREFGMAAIANGLALHGGFIPYSGTFLTFSDYSRNALRMAALMKLRNVFVFTHDSIGLGEDGPTHQSVEHVSSLRLIPNMDVWRPCDTVETAIAWAMAIERRDGPSSLALSRQNLPFVARSPEGVEHVRRGGYVLVDAADAKALVIATGSEVSIALAAQKALAAEGIAVRVVSMPCTSVFDRQDEAWRRSVLPPGLPRVSIEAGVTDYWRKYVGLEGGAVGVDRFGESAPAAEVYKYLGVDASHLAAEVRRVAGR
jgi:transketolase